MFVCLVIWSVVIYTGRLIVPFLGFVWCFNWCVYIYCVSFYGLVIVFSFMFLDLSIGFMCMWAISEMGFRVMARWAEVWRNPILVIFVDGNWGCDGRCGLNVEILWIFLHLVSLCV